jgi:hypothetical protein
VAKDLLQKSIDRKNEIIMHKINLLEVYYDTYKTYDEEKALKLLDDIKVSPIKITNEITDDILLRAGKLKVVTIRGLTIDFIHSCSIHK